MRRAGLGRIVVKSDPDELCPRRVLDLKKILCSWIRRKQQSQTWKRVATRSNFPSDRWYCDSVMFNVDPRSRHSDMREPVVLSKCSSKSKSVHRILIERVSSLCNHPNESLPLSILNSNMFRCCSRKFIEYVKKQNAVRLLTQSVGRIFKSVSIHFNVRKLVLQLRLD